MQSEKCKSCFECSETIVVMVRDERGGEWRESSVRRCANDQCWHIVDGTREDRLLWIDNVYGYKYFGNYELSPEQLSAVYEAKALAALSDKQAGEVNIKPLEWHREPRKLFARSPFIQIFYEIRPFDMGQDCWKYKLEAFGIWTGPFFDTEDEAKAVAQADYEQRIRSALVDVPAVESKPVGYLFELFYSGSDRWSGQLFSDHDPADNLPAEHVRNVRPLYTRPPLREGEDSAEVLRSALQRISELTPARANAKDARDLHHTVKAIADVALAATRSASATTASGGDHG